jgi:hypothetical protein
MNDSGISFKLLFTAGSDDDIEKLAQQFAKERMDWYNLYGSKDKRFKPLDESTEYMNALKLLEEINGEHLKENDYIRFAIALKEKANAIDALDEKSAQHKLALMKQAKEYEEAADKLNRDRRNFDVETSKLRISLIQNEFEQKRRSVELEYNIEMTKLIELQKKEKDNIQNSRLTERMDLLRQQRDQALRQLQEDKINSNISNFTGVFNEIQNITSTLNIGANTFVSKMINGMQTVLALAQSVKNILELTGLIKLILGVATGGASGAIPAAAGIGANLPAAPTGFDNFFNNIKDNFIKSANYFKAYFSVTPPAAASALNGAMAMDVKFNNFVLKGEDLHGSVESYNTYLKSKRDKID